MAPFVSQTSTVFTADAAIDECAMYYTVYDINPDIKEADHVPASSRV